MNGPIRQVAATLFIGFAMLVAAVTYIQLVRGPEYRDDARNARVITGQAGRERGTIITADGVVVAESTADPADPRIFVRSYPEGELYAHTVGYATARYGTVGIERTRAEELVSDRDSTISGVLNAILGGDLRPRGLRLTLLHDLQTVAADALGDQRGAVVALDPRTGAVLAMVSTPSFDANLLTDPSAGDAVSAIEDDPDDLLRNRAIDATYPPGSTFKVITAAAALESGLASAGTAFPDEVELALPGSTATIRNFGRGPCGPDTTVTLEFAFTRSCNTVFALLGLQLGAGPLVATAQDAGFNQSVPFDLPVAESVIPNAASFTDDLPGVAQSAIGQRDVRATPLGMALVTAAVANGGEIMEPHLVAEVFNSDGEVETAAEPTVWRRAISPATAASLTELMENVVSAGTGGLAEVQGVRIAGKTGTAEVPDAAPHVWFVGFGPVDPQPDEAQIVIAVLVESGGSGGEDGTGGSVAAPIARSVFEAFFGIE